MSLLRLFPVISRPDVMTSSSYLLCGRCSYFLQPKLFASTAAKKRNEPRKKKTAAATKHKKLEIPYHNGASSPGPPPPENPNRGVVFDLQFDTPPVLFIRKYREVIDTRDIVFKDELNELEKCGEITPQNLTQKKIKYIQDAVKHSKTFEKLQDSFRKKPDPPFSQKVTEGEEKRSVFTDSDFENIRTESVQGLQIKDEIDLEWSTTKLDLASLPKHYLTLSKARLTLLVCMTATGGYAMAPGVFNFHTAACATLGTAMASAAANAINQILEVPFDSQMNRTKNRVLVRGCLSPFHAFSFAAAMTGAGTLLLYTQVNELAAALSLLNLVLYTSVYTPLKRVSIVNTWVGSIVGAIPPLIGWSAATGGLEPGAFILAGVLFSWQFPHFNSLSWNLRPDYSKAGYRMMSVTHPDLCRRVALRHSLACIGICTAAPLLDLTTWAFAADSLVLNLYLTLLAYKFYQKADSNSSRKLFRFTLIHLPLIMILMWISKKAPGDAEPASWSLTGTSGIFGQSSMTAISSSQTEALTASSSGQTKAFNS